MMNLNKLIGHNRVVGIEVNFESETVVSYTMVEVSIQNDLLRLEPIAIENQDFDHLLQVIPKKVPVCLILTGKGVVVKGYKADAVEDSESILKQIFPIAKTREFSLNTYTNIQGESWAGIVRTEQLTQVISGFIDSGLVVADVFIGPFVLKQVLSLLENDICLIKTPAYEVAFVNESITRIDKNAGTQEVYQIAGKQIKGCDLIALAGSYQYLAENNGKTTCEVKSVVISANDFKANKALALFMKAGIGIMFALLMANFFVFSHFNTKVNSVNQEVLLSRSLLTQKKKLEKELTEKKALLSTTGLNSQSNLSYYADKIASLRPKSMVFEEMVLNPVEINQYKQNLLIQNNTIQIKGYSTSSLQINNWVNQLSELGFVESSELIDLKYSNNNKTTEYTLRIKIRI